DVHDQGQAAVAQSSQKLSFSLKALPHLFGHSGLVQDHLLESPLFSGKPEVFAEIDRSHTASTDKADQLVAVHHGRAQFETRRTHLDGRTLAVNGLCGHSVKGIARGAFPNGPPEILDASR